MDGIKDLLVTLEALKAVHDNFVESMNNKVDKENGKGLSSNDYDAPAKQKVDAIPENPVYTDTIYDDTELKNEIQAVIGNLSDLDTTVKSNLVAAINEALFSGGGSVSAETIQQIVDNYLAENPPGTGKDGADGITPTIGSNGNWYLGSVDTGKPSRGAKGDKGDAGSIGPKGADGATPDIQIGTVTTLPAGSNATASMGGTAESPLLNLGIPKGADGQGGGSGGSETWELIKSITVPDGAEESTALTISADESGNAFSLKKARLYAFFPAYTGSTKTPTFSMFMLNGITVGANAPYCYTSGWVVPVSSIPRDCRIEVDLTIPGLQCERVSRSTGTTGIEYFGEPRISAVTSIGGVQMLIYPGCKFWLYGVRA